jgi:hypothetical protein
MKVLPVIVALLVLYVLSYAVLSLCGRYQPMSIGAAGVKQYAWAPFGFYDADHAWARSAYAVHYPTEKTGGWRNYMMWSFAPLWWLDFHYIHSGPSSTVLNDLQ